MQGGAGGRGKLATGQGRRRSRRGGRSRASAVTRPRRFSQRPSGELRRRPPPNLHRNATGGWQDHAISTATLARLRDENVQDVGRTPHPGPPARPDCLTSHWAGRRPQPRPVQSGTGCPTPRAAGGPHGQPRMADRRFLKPDMTCGVVPPGGACGLSAGASVRSASSPRSRTVRRLPSLPAPSPAAAGSGRRAGPCRRRCALRA